MDYRHMQVGWVIVAPVLLGTLVFVAMSSAGGIVFPPDAPAWVPWLVPLGLLLLLINFGTMTVEVDREAMRVRFGVGLIRKTVAMAEVVSVEVVSFPWYVGWGIRLTPQGWLYRVAGTRGVRLTLVGGKKFNVGTDEPERLAEALRSSGMVGGVR
jgi:hypothetical protein